MPSITPIVRRTTFINAAAKQLFSCSALLALLFFGGSTGYAADKLEPVLKDRGKHYQTEGEVIPVPDDGIHDPTNDAVHVFQAPSEAMANFPRDAAGLVNWVKTIEQGMIAPRADMYGEAEKETLDMDIIYTETGKMPHVRFSHLAHTEWLDCSNCHPALFKQKKGATNIAMTDVLTGKYCGLCHGKVAFPPTKNCMRCHSVSQSGGN